MSEKLIITPKTKVMQVIDAYPDLEDVLIEFVPAFKKLKNPVLRKTVGRITTLQQAAVVGNVKVEDLINRLRKDIGQDLYEENAGTTYQNSAPAWFNKCKLTKELDARPMLAAGEHPVAQVMADLSTFEAGEVYKLIAPFIPAPLIDKATSLGFDHYLVKEAEETFVVFFCKK